MNLQNLKEFFLNERTIEEVIEEIHSEVECYQIGHAKVGSSIPVYATNDNFHFIIGDKDVKKLCDMYLKGKVNEWYLDYICNLLELSSSFSMGNEEIEEAIFELSSPEINSPITPDLVKRICQDL